jgi:hypothetical protein
VTSYEDNDLPPARVTPGRRLQLNPQPLRVRPTIPQPPATPAERTKQERVTAEINATLRHDANKPHDKTVCLRCEDEGCDDAVNGGGVNEHKQTVLDAKAKRPGKGVGGGRPRKVEG